MKNLLTKEQARSLGAARKTREAKTTEVRPHIRKYWGSMPKKARVLAAFERIEGACRLAERLDVLDSAETKALIRQSIEFLENLL